MLQLAPTRDSTSELLDALWQREVAVFGPSTPGQTRTPNEGNGTQKRNIFFGNLCICIADQHRGSCSAIHRGSWSSRSSSTAAVVAATSRQRRRRVPLESWAVVFCLRCGACALCILALGHSPAAEWLFTAQQHRTCYAAAAVMTTVVGGKRTLLPATGKPCRVSRRIHHTASSTVRPVALDAGLPTQSQR